MAASFPPLALILKYMGALADMSDENTTANLIKTAGLLLVDLLFLRHKSFVSGVSSLFGNTIFTELRERETGWQSLLTHLETVVSLSH